MGGAKGSSLGELPGCCFSRTCLHQQVGRNILLTCVGKGVVPVPVPWDVTLNLESEALGELLRGGHRSRQEGRAAVWEGEGGLPGTHRWSENTGSRPRSAGRSALRGQRLCHCFHGPHTRCCSPSVCRSRCGRQDSFHRRSALGLRPTQRVRGISETVSKTPGLSGLLGSTGTVKGGSPPAGLAQNPFPGVLRGSAHTCTHTYMCTWARAHVHTHTETIYTEAAFCKETRWPGAHPECPRVALTWL